ncbi:MAG: hypothetical protein KDD21_00580 [Bacteroidetes bacterium]|nr:hypothetical protein [Bacteroidota bacterium]
MKSKIAIFSILLCLASLLPAKNNVNITVKLKNGDVVTGKADLPNLSISSAYGNLKIPIEKITNLKLGIVSDHTKDGAVLPDLNKLQTVSETDAKSIYERLLGYGTPILATVINFTENPFYQVSSNENYTIEQLIDALYQKAGLQNGDDVNDAITFDGSNYIEGSVNFGDITIQSDYGNLVFKRDKIESLDISPLIVSTDGSFILKGNVNISGNENDKGWVNTGVSVKPGDKFTITASGKVVLKSLSGGTYNPDGWMSGKKDAAYTDDMETKYGSVVYRIGTYGTITQAGSNYEGTASEEGNIYISIYETVYDKGNSGFYKVKVNK